MATNTNVPTEDFILLENSLKNKEIFSARHQEIIYKKYLNLIKSYSYKNAFLYDSKEDAEQESYFVMLKTFDYLSKNFDKIKPESFSFGYFFKNRLIFQKRLLLTKKNVDIVELKEEMVEDTFDCFHGIIEEEYKNSLYLKAKKDLTKRQVHLFELLSTGNKVTDILNKLNISRVLLYRDVNFLSRAIYQAQ